jgi:hypothetical protein
MLLKSKSLAARLTIPCIKPKANPRVEVRTKTLFRKSENEKPKHEDFSCMSSMPCIVEITKA